MRIDFAESKRKRRDRLHIIAEILNTAKKGTLKTQIMYRANLSFAQLKEYLPFLLKTGFLRTSIENGKTVYATTAKADKYLENYIGISDLLIKKKVKLKSIGRSF